MAVDICHLFLVIRVNDDLPLQRILAILPGPGRCDRPGVVPNVSQPPSGGVRLANVGRFQTCMLCINTWFLRKRGLAMGIMVSGSSLGGVIFPIMLDRLFGSVGFGWGVRAAGFLIFGLLVIANFLVKSRLPPPGWVKGRKLFDLDALKEPTFVLALVYTSSWVARGANVG
jgi:MFS family permease